MSHKLSGRPWRRLAARFKTICKARNEACWRCNLPIDYDAEPETSNAFEADHYWPRDTHPHLAYDITNLRPSHSSCNRSRRNEQPGAWQTADW